MNKGHFIVIEGTDGSGKGTQIKPIATYLKSQGIKVEIVDFPQYEDNIYGKLVGEYLKGDFGGIKDVHPKLAALPYLLDRLVAKPKIEKLLEKGVFVIANRYASSNRAFMAARLPEGKRSSLLNWLRKAEYKINKIPQEELIILLNVTPDVSQKNVDSKEQRGYLKGKKRDIHEDNLDYQKEVAKVYLKLAKEEGYWEVINCMRGKEMKKPEVISEEIIKVLKKRGII